VDVVRHEAIGVKAEAKSIAVVDQAFQVELPIGVGSKHVSLFVASGDDVVHGARELQTRRSGHQDRVESIEEIRPSNLSCREKEGSGLNSGQG
jgi:hypothetical protein